MDFVKSEVEALAVMINKGFENTVRDVRDEIVASEQRLGRRMDSLDARMDGVEVRTGRMEGNFAALEKNMERRFGALDNEFREIKTVVLNIEHALQDKLEAQGDELQDARQRLERLERHAGLPGSLSAAA
jgi:archaellum component FlaC